MPSCRAENEPIQDLYTSRMRSFMFVLSLTLKARQGAIGIAGLVAAIYPIESPGGYQLYGRTLPAWQTWGKGKDFHAERPWLLEPFDQVCVLASHDVAASFSVVWQVVFKPIREEDYIEVRFLIPT